MSRSSRASAARRATTGTWSQVAADGATVAGTTIGQENRQWLVEALGYQLEIELAPKMALLLYEDVPG